jgi:5-formyltetrahydrofolate cyclo-ligase
MNQITIDHHDKSNQLNKSQLRREIRRRRKQLSEAQQLAGAEQLADRVMKAVQQQKAQKVALFLSMDGEIRTNATIKRLWLSQIDVFIPLVHPFNPHYLVFIRYGEDTELTRSPLGMLEPKPDCSQLCPLVELDILLTPLVAFDSRGHRLGMGGGFYDRTLACHYQQMRNKPEIIGVAHDCQQVDIVPTESWDIPLSAMLTPSTTFVWPKS